MAISDNNRPNVSTDRADPGDPLTYAAYLSLDTLLSSQHPRSDPEHHDETLFIIQHQATELWLKLIIHELDDARRLLASDELGQARKRIARVKDIQEVLIQQWTVLTTLTPTEYAQFRGALASASGIQSAQYRQVEFALGNRAEDRLRVFESSPAEYATLTAELERPSLYDEFLRHLARTGHAVPTEILDREVRRAYVFHEPLVAVFERIYSDAEEHWQAYEACEELVDLEDNFQLWRFRHLRTVARTIGSKRGTGGSSGVGFLRHALDVTFFPELYAVRTRIGA
jgi:tryptophan 2,3-dioxygenase